MWGRASGGSHTARMGWWEIGEEARLLLEPSKGGRYIYTQSEGAVRVASMRTRPWVWICTARSHTPPSELLLVFNCGSSKSDAGSDPLGKHTALGAPHPLLLLSRHRDTCGDGQWGRQGCPGLSLPKHSHQHPSRSAERRCCPSNTTLLAGDV